MEKAIFFYSCLYFWIYAIVHLWIIDYMSARKYIFFGYILYFNIIKYIVSNVQNHKPKDSGRNLLGSTIVIRLTPRDIDVNSIEQHIKKFFFIGSKKMENQNPKANYQNFHQCFLISSGSSLMFNLLFSWIKP